MPTERTAPIQGATADSSVRRARTCSDQPIGPRRQVVALRTGAGGVVWRGTGCLLDGLSFDRCQPFIPFTQIARAVRQKGARVAGPVARPPCSAASISVSVRPSITAGPNTGSAAFWNSPCLSATRQPSRLPLSTVER